ncbi:MerR family DNA-binding protein [Streptomyces sp. NPDC056291]|uniref:MerR family DNA-binding protein n=1 Tax=Streptomyces sp. NPDC056291 TaxID=3345772 RepID=UPI0035D57D71
MAGDTALGGPQHAPIGSPERTPSGYRVYTDADAERLRFIKSAQRLGLSLDDIREILAFRDRGELPCGHVRHLVPVRELIVWTVGQERAK